MRRALLLLAGLLGCTDPSVRRAGEPLSTVSGTVLVSRPAESAGCVRAKARGPVMLFLFDADDPPPPAGAGRPVSFVLVPERELFPDGVAVPPGALLRADYVFPNVPPGRYLVQGFLDADGDFNPAEPTLAQPTAGDLLGGRVDDAGRLRPLEVPEATAVGQVAVRIGRPAPLERPAFRIATATLTAPAREATRLRLEAVALDALAMMPGCTGFRVTPRGSPGADGNRDGLEDLFPQVLLTRVAPEGEGRVVAEAVVNPLPFRDALADGAATSTPALDLILPPAHAVVRAGAAPEPRRGLPAGSYAVTVIAATGQTWTVPNRLEEALPEAAVPPAQAAPLRIAPGPAAPPGRIEGAVTVPPAAGDATVWVFAFSAQDPAPPLGAGAPVAATSAGAPGASEQRFVLEGLSDGAYALVALADVDGDLSPFVSLLSEPSAADLVARPEGAVEVAGGGGAGPVQIRLPAEPVGFSRPVFDLEGGTRLDVRELPASIRLRGRAAPALGVAAPARFPVTRSPAELDGLPPADVLPRVLLVRLADGAEGLTLDPRGVVVPGWVSPVPHLGRLTGPSSVAPVDALDVLVLPTALRRGPDGLAPIGRPPDGRYQVVVFSPTGQTWSVPNRLNAALGRAGGGDPSQARAVEIVGGADVPGGGIEGQVQLALPPPRPSFTVAVFAHALDDPPPPRGAGRPRAAAFLGAEAFGGGTSAPFRLEGLARGRYTVTALLDADADFMPWIPPLAQPDAGDFAGGVFDGAGRLRALEVPARGRARADAVIGAGGRVPMSPPAFRFRAPPVMDVQSPAGVAARLELLDADTPLGRIRGELRAQWVDLDGNGRADDVDGDGRLDVFPLVVAERLDEAGAGLDPEGWRIVGRVDPRDLASLGFPASDPTRVDAQVAVRSVRVRFAASASRRESAELETPPAGRWRVTVVAGSGQTWAVPNVLGAAGGTALAASQSAALVTR